MFTLTDLSHPCAYVHLKIGYDQHVAFIWHVSAGRKKTVMCRCKRAWLPPSATWLFPPRCATHTTGGWYIEWGGYKHREHPLCVLQMHA